MVDPGADVIAMVEAGMERYGVPGHIRSDNGPEFIAHANGDWLKERSIATLYIKAGAPSVQSFCLKLFQFVNERITV